MSQNDEKIDITEQFETFFPEFIRELKNVYSNLPDEEVRTNLDNPRNTEFLFNNIRSNSYFESKYMHLYDNPNPTTKKFNLYTLSSPEDEEQKYVVFEVRRTGIGIYFKQYDPEMFPVAEFVDDGIEDLNSNNIGLSWDPADKWYIYGVKTNDKGVFISGNLAQKYAFEIAKSCKLREFFIHDAAVVNCKFGVSEEKDIKDENDIKHFSLARILNGKPGFYENPPTVNYRQPDEAAKAKKYLVEVFYETLDERDKKILKDFVNCARIYCSDIPITQCAELNQILEKAHEELIVKEFLSDRLRVPRATVLEELIYLDTKYVGGKRKKVKKTIKKKKTKTKRGKNSKKTIKKKKTKKVKKTKKSR